MKKLLYTLLAVSTIFSSCKDNKSASPYNPTMVNQNIYSVIDISNSPQGTYSYYTSTSTANFQTLGGSVSHTTDNWILDWVSGNTISYNLSLSFTTQFAGCADVEIRTYNNTNLINTENFQIGYSQLSPNIYCDTSLANNNFNMWLTIVAD